MKPLRLWFGSVLIALGAVWLLDAAGVLSAEVMIGRWWPVAVIALAVTALVGERRPAPGPAVLLVIGGALLANQLTSINIGRIVWGGVVIGIGAWLLIDVARPQSRKPLSSETQDVFALLGGSHSSNRSARFRHADVMAVLGGATLDLRDATPAPGARVDALALFGGVDIVVPEGWRVEMSGLPILGGYQDKTGGAGGPAPDAPALKVVATALFGGVEVKNLSRGRRNTGEPAPRPPAVSQPGPGLR